MTYELQFIPAALNRLVYKVYDKEVVVLVLAVGKREKSRVYNQAVARKSSVVETFASGASCRE